MALIAKFTVVHKGKTFNSGSVLPSDVSEEDAKLLIEGGFAEENPELEAPKAKGSKAKGSKAAKSEDSTNPADETSNTNGSEDGSQSSDGEGEGSAV